MQIDGTRPLGKRAFQVEAASSKGRRHSHNEDAYLVNAEARIFAVADGMGGHREGYVASNAIVSVLGHVLTPQEDFEHRINTVSEAIHRANHSLFSQTQKEAAADISGSTLVSVILDEDYACCLWVGDSRLYLLRKDWLYLISEDHARQDGALTRAVGCMPDVEIDRRIIEIKEGDKLVLCSDGLIKGVNEEELADILSQGGEALAERLVAKAIVGGSLDDITVVLLEIVGDD
ncbi:protein phosphatase 2C domain-containing protein [uncultured Cohaesibacter sp.]|uniref:PP2C family protein-serine/threonine phosphatase n=1 Tax=uncultured Cohaesibacter sp. TaxID=1002546 RepID=UPI0029C8062C|nr:protein phosphatase 2C domain-containing protein [uncultured Cohaesibacter sp.]